MDPAPEKAVTAEKARIRPRLVRTAGRSSAAQTLPVLSPARSKAAAPSVTKPKPTLSPPWATIGQPSAPYPPSTARTDRSSRRATPSMSAPAAAPSTRTQTAQARPAPALARERETTTRKPSGTKSGTSSALFSGASGSCWRRFWESSWTPWPLWPERCWKSSPPSLRRF